MRKENENRTACDVFTEIYSNNRWGGKSGELHSGSGSRGLAADAYCDMVSEFIKKHNIKSIVDVGCGDFQIGKRIAPLVQSYIGIDVVTDLINLHSSTYGSDAVHFVCLDVTHDALPTADLCLVRQVFQHLSNSQISSVLKKTRGFEHVMVTEHYPKMTDKFIVNRDKPHGADTRIYDDSAVVLDSPPFCVSPIEMVLSVPVVDYLVDQGETINTYLFSGTAIKDKLYQRT
jgi:SAM-dependent methyltransferase